MLWCCCRFLFCVIVTVWMLLLQQCDDVIVMSLLLYKQFVGVKITIQILIVLNVSWSRTATARAYVISQTWRYVFVWLHCVFYILILWPLITWISGFLCTIMTGCYCIHDRAYNCNLIYLNLIFKGMKFFLVISFTFHTWDVP